MQMIIFYIIIINMLDFRQLSNWGFDMRWLHALVAGIALSVTLMYSGTSWAEPFFNQFELEAIGQTADVALEDYAGKPLILAFFEPACSWCARQLRDLVKLQQVCDDGLKVVAVGVHGRKPALEQVMARSGARSRLTAALSNPSLLSAIGGVPATPYTLVIDAEGRFETLLRGYASLEKLHAILADRFGTVKEKACPVAPVSAY
jgi:peroxiredoxin